MSGSFGGFTEKDIEKIKNSKKDLKKTPVKMLRKNNKLVPVTTNPPDDNPTVHSNVTDVDVKPVNPIIDTKPEPETRTKDEENNMVTIDLNTTNNDCENNEIESLKEEPSSITDNILTDGSNFIDSFNLFNNNPERKPINLEAFEKTQKLIEEQNRKRKEMLSRALEDRTKQTTEEAQRLDTIKKELQTLDAQLHDDVAILRKQIDKASIIYSEVEKNYFKVEKEFLQAKLALQKEKEKKDLLTEHLCTLIAYNESRKAKKLESLMDQLIYKTDTSPASSICDGVCEKTGKMLEMENGQVILRDDD